MLWIERETHLWVMHIEFRPIKINFSHIENAEKKNEFKEASST